VEWAQRLRARDLGGQGCQGRYGRGHLPQIMAVTTVSERELWRSFPEVTRNDVLGLLYMLLERLAVSPMPAAEGPGVSMMLADEHGEGKIQGWHRDRLAAVYVRRSSRQQVADHG
jgi:hypothetical protein